MLPSLNIVLLISAHKVYFCFISEPDEESDEEMDEGPSEADEEVDECHFRAG
jgi:hypothetical protein